VAELPGIGAVDSMRLKILHVVGVRGKSLRGEPELPTCQWGKGEADEEKGGCQHTIAGKIPKIESGR
jgi:hypothetical protein